MTINDDITRGESQTRPGAGLPDVVPESFEAEDVSEVCQSCGVPSAMGRMNSGSEADVTQVRPHRVSDSDAAGGSTENKERSGNSVNMSIQTGGLDFKLDTRIDPNQQSIELSAKLELCLSMLAASQNRLEVAFVRIGQLEAELAVLRTIHSRSDGSACEEQPARDGTADRRTDKTTDRRAEKAADRSGDIAADSSVEKAADKTGGSGLA
ncbi:MAG: hypothetical protein HY986_00325 [Candidatus Melainabacteria bacterium]|nr:hypothetical protein [Candidatus Melainabacteria bacterium]